VGLVLTAGWNELSRNLEEEEGRVLLEKGEAGSSACFHACPLTNNLYSMKCTQDINSNFDWFIFKTLTPYLKFLLLRVLPLINL
jgi:hypothetical protein